MDKKDELQNKLKVELQPREVNLIGLAQKLKEQEMLYNNNTQSTREDILRGSENTILNMYAYAGLLLSINELYGGVVDTKITSRKKSIVSARRKENRPDREGKKTKDTIGSTICIERVHNSMNFSNFFDDDKIQAEYNERMQNIDLMKIVIDFLESLPMETISSELDNATPQEDSESISKLKEKREEVKENVKVYYKESRKEDDEIIRMDKTKLIREICQSLTEEEIHKAETNGIESLLEELKRKKEESNQKIKELERKLEYLTDKTIIEKTESDLEDEKDIQDSIEENIERIKKNIKRLHSGNKKDSQKQELLRDVLNPENMKLFNEIIKSIEEKEALFINVDSEETKNKAKTYCELLIIMLYQLKQLEIIPKSEYTGKTYDNILSNLLVELRQYKAAEVDAYKKKGSSDSAYSNITYNDLQKMVTNLIRINARLSDRLQFDILSYIMEKNLKQIIQYITGEELSEPDVKAKSNGYVAIHWDLGEMQEIKGITHYRERVANMGSASYGNGREENQDEKKRDVDLLKLSRAAWPAKMKNSSKRRKNNAPKLANPQKIQIPLQIKEDFRKKEEAREITESIKQLLQTQKPIYQKELLSRIPMYAEYKYNPETGKVHVKFFSEIENVAKYYLETNVVEEREKVVEMLERLRKTKILSDIPTEVEISKEEYRTFLQKDLHRYRNIISRGLEKALETSKNK